MALLLRWTKSRGSYSYRRITRESYRQRSLGGHISLQNTETSSRRPCARCARICIAWLEFIRATFRRSEIPPVLLGIPWSLRGPLRNQFWKKRRPQLYWGGESSGNALEASNALNYRVWGIPAVLSREISGNALRAFPGSFRNLSGISSGKSQPYWGYGPEERLIRLNFWDTLWEQFCLSDQSALIDGSLGGSPL